MAKRPQTKIVRPVPATVAAVQAISFNLFGLGADFTDPDAATFAYRMRDELGVDIQGSPYRYYQTDEIIGRINCAPTGTIIFVVGTSLGANNAQVIAAQVSKPINSFLFQASEFGAQNPIAPTVQFFHNIYNPFERLGSFKPQLGEGNSVTVPMWTERRVHHPGDGDRLSQNMFLDQMKRIIEGTLL